MNYLIKALLLFSPYCFLDLAYSSTEFLSNSKILKKANIDIIPAQLTPEKDVLPVVNSEHVGMAVFLSDDGQSYVIKKKENSKNLKLNIRSCGADELAAPWKSVQLIHGSGLFIAKGQNLNNVKFKWVPATESHLKTTPACISYKKGYAIRGMSVSEVTGLSEKIFQVHFASPEEVRWQKLYNKFKEEAYKMKPINCGIKDIGFDRLGSLKDGSCRTLIESKVNCEGQGFENGSFDKLLGVLNIVLGSEIERWLVFLAHGYEGDAYLGILLNDDRPSKKSNIHFYVYSGC